MKYFIIKTTVFILSIAFPFLLVNSIIGWSPKVYSNSVSFNAKMFDIKNNHLSDNPAILSIGSSMSLNNISTQSVRLNIDSNFLNISSWGQSIEFTYRNLVFFDTIYKPKIVIFPFNIGDFHTISPERPNLTAHFYKSLFNPYDIEWNALRKPSREYHYYRKDSSNYNFLGFDKNGGVSLNRKGFNISPLRWQKDTIYPPDLTQYSYLDSAYSLSIQSGFRLVLIQTPLRMGWQESRSALDSILLSQHVDKLTKYSEESGVQFINGLRFVSCDSLFVDYSHLSRDGSTLFTDSICKLIKSNTNVLHTNTSADGF